MDRTPTAHLLDRLPIAQVGFAAVTTVLAIANLGPLALVVGPIAVVGWLAFAIEWYRGGWEHFTSERSR